jgi:ABC-2 type transport system permease protein
MTMMSAIFSMILGGLVISHEEDEKTIEFLISHPVTRFEIALSKFAAFTFLVVIFNLVLLIADFIVLEVFKTSAGYNRAAFLGIWTSELILIFFFGAAGMLYSSFVTKGGAVVGTCIAIPLITGILGMLGEVESTVLKLLSYLSPYRYFDVPEVLTKGGAQPGFIIVFLIIAAAFITTTFALYKRKEFAN